VSTPQMTGPEHYFEAERFLRVATEQAFGRHHEVRDDEHNLTIAEALAAANAHAALAMVAFNASNAYGGYKPTAQWREIAAARSDGQDQT
jgi:hypothetical protein